MTLLSNTVLNQYSVLEAILLLFIICLYVCAGANACVCVFLAVFICVFFTTLHYDAILSVMRRTQLGLSLLCFRNRL